MHGPPDAVVVGGGPNGLAAAVELQRNGVDVLLLEAEDTVGGAARTEELTLPGFLHDVGSAVHPLGVGSPFFSSLPLEEHGLEWVHPEIPLAHPLDGGRGAFLHRDLERCLDGLGPDGPAYRRLVGPFVEAWPTFVDHVLDAPTRIPRAPLLMARFGLSALRSTPALAARLRTEEARALLAGNAAHGGIPLEHPLSGAIALVLMVAGHAVGWPSPKGGAGSITRALARHLTGVGGRIETGVRVRSLDELPEARATILALTHRQVAEVAGDRLPGGYRDRLAGWRYGPGAFKVDWALDEPIPWENPEVARAGTVHLGGTLTDIALAERGPWQDRVAGRPFVLLAQPTLFDPSRAPDGRHVAWAYVHVPPGWDTARGGGGRSIVELLEAQIERFAPGFRDTILARSTLSPAGLEAWDANLVDGDVNGGTLTIGQTVGPLRSLLHPWSTPVDGLYVCSASRPPGGGVHGMVGYRAAREALKRTFGID